jgi:putative two-component system response regulator
VDDIPGWKETYDENGIMFCTDITKLDKPHRDILEPQGIKSMLHCAIRDKGIFRGYIGFDDCKEPRMWTREQIELLTFFSEALSMFLLRQRRQEKVQRQADEMRFILDSQDAWIYVVDPDSYALCYVNARLREKHPHVAEGMTCYRVLENRQEPCEHCPLKMLTDRKSYTGPTQGKDRQETMLVEGTKIRWNGNNACLVSGRRVPG